MDHQSIKGRLLKVCMQNTGGNDARLLASIQGVSIYICIGIHPKVASESKTWQVLLQLSKN